ncbi:hypothetical protein RHGRI_010596 [Rhododendron griersonianum]|uniref:Uncharacterized protein n=1 Tax=Rhododendron griersonianum TaxID=479676 RepID=A0AAV6KJ24_9ERIC|nr:hypothetical protein RHGRI_010596 [Rhododendron griersonianum]
MGAWGEFKAAKEAVQIHVPPFDRPPPEPKLWAAPPPGMLKINCDSVMPLGRTLLRKVGGALSSGILEGAYWMVGDFVPLLIRLSLQRPLFLEKHASLPKP